MDRGAKEIARGFLKVGATAFGGPAIMGLMRPVVLGIFVVAFCRLGGLTPEAILPGFERVRGLACATLWGRP